MPALGMAQANDQFVVESELWIEGQVHEVPVMIVTAGEPAMVSRKEDLGEERWRLEIELEPDGDALSPVPTHWVSVAIQQFSDGEWEFLADSILGVPEGQVATLSVDEGDVSDPSPENSMVFMNIGVSRLSFSPEQQP